MSSSDGVAQLLADASVLLLDFDGPVCKVFAGHPAPPVAHGLSVLVVEKIENADPTDLQTDDPIEVLRIADRYRNSDLLVTLENELCKAELEAVTNAAATPYAADAIKAAHKAGRRVVVVSNNSSDAIRKYLDQHGLADFVSGVVGRPFACPSLMKPNPRGVRYALAVLQAPPGSSVLIGDSVTDIEAAQGAGVRSIGFANREGKHAKLIAAGADAIIDGEDGMRRIWETYASLT